MSKVQSVHFSRQHWTNATSRAKLNEMGYTALKAVHVTPHFYEYRVQNPEQFDHFATLKRKNGIQIVIGFYHPKK